MHPSVGYPFNGFLLNGFQLAKDNHVYVAAIWNLFVRIHRTRRCKRVVFPQTRGRLKGSSTLVDIEVPANGEAGSLSFASSDVSGERWADIVKTNGNPKSHHPLVDFLFRRSFRRGSFTSGEHIHAFGVDIRISWARPM